MSITRYNIKAEPKMEQQRKIKKLLTKGYVTDIIIELLPIRQQHRTLITEQ
jgi:hypothetical protein